MMTLRPAAERGHAQHGWLDSYHTFSFADYHDEKQMGFRALRVINEDRIAPAQGFGTHPHRDMEILSYVLEGGIEHKDSIGTGSVIRPGEVQRMSAGTGVRHSEFNASKTDSVHFLQIWIVPAREGIQPSYEQKAFAESDKRGKLRVVASMDGRFGSVTIHSDVVVHAGFFDAGESAELPLREGRHAWVHVARGKVRIEGSELSVGDGAGITGQKSVKVEGVDGGEVLIFDLA